MRKLLILAAASALLMACETNDYETGTGATSLLQTDMAEFNVDANKRVSSFTTDNGETFRLSPATTASWIDIADTTYHGIIYFNRLSSRLATALKLIEVPTLRAKEHWRFKQLPQDPVGIESIWMSHSARYINIGVLLKTGVVDGSDGIHSVGLAQDTLLATADGKLTAFYRLLHSQGDIPQYYTSRNFLSIALPDTVTLDTLHLSINTFDGTVERTFVVKP